jgi:hypothetical protein
MSDEKKPSRFRAILKNAIVWGAGWGILGAAVASIIRLTDNIPLLHAILDGIGMGVRIGVVGGITGAAFAAFISVAYRGKRLSEINWLKFGLGGLVLGGLFVPAFLETMSLLTGGGFVPFKLISDDILMSALFGGITAAGTMRLAQHGSDTDAVAGGSPLENLQQQQSLGPGEIAGIPAGHKSRATERHA